MFDSFTDSQLIDLNIVPISSEGVLLGMLGYPAGGYSKVRLFREMEVQERLLADVELNSPEYLEIKANLDEVFAQLWACKDLV